MGVCASPDAHEQLSYSRLPPCYQIRTYCFPKMFFYHNDQSRGWILHFYSFYFYIVLNEKKKERMAFKTDFEILKSFLQKNGTNGAVNVLYDGKMSEKTDILSSNDGTFSSSDFRLRMCCEPVFQLDNTVTSPPPKPKIIQNGARERGGAGEDSFAPPRGPGGLLCFGGYF